MNESLSAEELKQLIAGYVLEDLNPEESERIRYFIGKNPEITAEIRVLQEVLALLPHSLPQAEPSDRLRSQIISNASQPASIPKTSSWQGLPWQKMITAIAAFVAIFAAVNNYYLRQELRFARDRDTTAVIAALGQSDTRIYQLAGTKDATNAVAKIIYSPSQAKAFLLVNNLPEVKSEQVYRLWAIVGREKVACADFRTNTSGSTVNEVSFLQNVCSTTQATLAVTLESFPAPEQPLGSVVLLEKS
jgi:anti-sigma-K factor RskA